MAKPNKFHIKRITGLQLFAALSILCILYAGHSVYTDMVIKKIQNLLPQKIDSFMHSDKTYILLSEMVNLRWDSVCIKRNEKIDYLTFFQNETQIATFSFESKSFKFSEAPAGHLACSSRSKAILKKSVSEFYFSELL